MPCIVFCSGCEEIGTQSYGKDFVSESETIRGRCFEPILMNYVGDIPTSIDATRTRKRVMALLYGGMSAMNNRHGKSLRMVALVVQGRGWISL